MLRNTVMATSAMAALGLAAAISSSASAAVLVFTDQFLYNIYTTSYTRATETFDTYSGSYVTAVGGNLGPVNWSAGAIGGVNAVGGRLVAASSTPMTVDFGGGNNVFGLSGNFFGTDAAGNVVPSLMLITLADGTSYMNLIDTASAFVGFVSTGPAISSMQMTAQALPGGAQVVYPSLDNMGLAFVPAPGALALLGLAGLAGSRRRR